MSDQKQAVPLPVYTASYVASCPDCFTDLVDEAFSFWCTECQRSWSFAEVAYFDEGMPPDE